MKEIIVTNKYDKKLVYNVIKKEFPHLNLASLNKAFRTKDIKVNDKRIGKTFIVTTGDVIKVYIQDKILHGISGNINYAYEDDNILVAYKLKGIESNFETGIRNENTLFFDELVKKEKGNVKICHRLDTNTEGLIIFSKNDKAYNEIISAFKENLITKEYIALVYSKPIKKSDTLKNYIIKDSKANFSKIYDQKVNGSKECISEYSLYEYIKDKNVSIITIKIHTGRTHQIRAQMKHLGTPVIGDPKYSTNEINDKFKLYSQVLYAAKYTFNFSKSSPLHYLNNTIISIQDEVIKKIYNLIK